MRSGDRPYALPPLRISENIIARLSGSGGRFPPRRAPRLGVCPTVVLSYYLPWTFTGSGSGTGRSRHPWPQHPPARPLETGPRPQPRRARLPPRALGKPDVPAPVPATELRLRRGFLWWGRNAFVLAVVVLVWQVLLIARGVVSGLLAIVLLTVFAAVVALLCGPATSLLRRQARLPSTLAALLTLIVLVGSHRRHHLAGRASPAHRGPAPGCGAAGFPGSSQRSLDRPAERRHRRRHPEPQGHGQQRPG